MWRLWAYDLGSLPCLQVAKDCLARAKDLSGLLLLHTATGSAAGMDMLVSAAQDQGKHNVQFLAAFLLGRLSDCVDLLISSGRIPEAAFFARTYLPSRVSEVPPASSCTATLKGLVLPAVSDLPGDV